MSMKTAYEKKLRAQLDEWSADIDKLKAKVKGAEADAQLQYNEEIAKLQSMRDRADTKLSELEAAGDSAWEDLKSGVESAWDSLAVAVKSASSRFK